MDKNQLIKLNRLVLLVLDFCIKEGDPSCTKCTLATGNNLIDDCCMLKRNPNCYRIIKNNNESFKDIAEQMIKYQTMCLKHKSCEDCDYDDNGFCAISEKFKSL